MRRAMFTTLMLCFLSLVLDPFPILQSDVSIEVTDMIQSHLLLLLLLRLASSALLFGLYTGTPTLSLHPHAYSRVVPHSLQCSKLSLFDEQQRVFANLGRRISSSVGVLNRNELFRRRANLSKVSRGHERSCGITHVLVSLAENLVDPLLSKKIFFHLALANTLTAKSAAIARRRSSVHPVELLDSFPTRRFLLHPLQLCKLTFLFSFLSQLVQFLGFFRLDGVSTFARYITMDHTYRCFFGLPHALLVDQEHGVP